MKWIMTNVAIMPTPASLSRSETDTLWRDPFFIIGAHRSGTTLLRYILSRSPRVHVPPESDFIAHFFHRRTTRPLSVAEASRRLEQVFQSHRYRLFAREWAGRPPTVELVCPDGRPCTPRQFVDRLFTAYARQRGATRWGDKSPAYCAHMPLLADLFPKARFVHLIRDGRDAALSMVEKWGRLEWHVDLFYAARQWARRVEAARATGRTLGDDRYMEVRYEDLAADPQRQLQHICDFLAEPFDPAMLSPQQDVKDDIETDNPFHARLHEPINLASVGRWRDRLTSTDRYIVERAAGPMLRSLGYGDTLSESGDCRALSRLGFLAGKYAVSHTLLRVAQMLGLHPVN